MQRRGFHLNTKKERKLRTRLKHLYFFPVFKIPDKIKKREREVGQTLPKNNFEQDVKFFPNKND